MILAIDNEVVLVVYDSHPAHHSGEVQDGVYAMHSFCAEDGVAKVTYHDFDVRWGRDVGLPGYIYDADLVMTVLGQSPCYVASL